MSKDTQVQNLIINKLTKAQYDSATKSDTELYYVTDEKVSISDVDGLQTSLDNKYDVSNPNGYITSSYHDSTKQDTISDLSTIRTNANLVTTKQDKLTAGNNIVISDENVISAKSSNVLVNHSSSLTPPSDATTRYCMGYGDGTYLFCGLDSTSLAVLWTSTDGVNWMKTYAATAGQFVVSLPCLVAYGNNMFVIGNTNQSYFYYTQDGTTLSITSVIEYPMNIRFVNDIFMAINNNGIIAYSSDGVNWTTTTISDTLTKYWKDINYCNGKYIALNYTGIIYYSDDLQNWQELTFSSINTGWYRINYGNGRFVITNYENAIVAYSDDMINWNEKNLDSSMLLYDTLFYNDLFVAIDYANGSKYYYSKNGIDWNTYYSKVRGVASTIRNLFHTTDSFVVSNYKSDYDNLQFWFEESETSNSIANTKLSNLDDDGKNTIDGQWVHSRKTLSTSTAISKYTISLGSYLPDDGYSYEVMVYLYLSRNDSSGTNSNVSVYDSNDNGTYTNAILYANVDGSNFQQNSIAGCLVVDSTRNIYLQVANYALSSGLGLYATRYRRIGTNE